MYEMWGATGIEPWPFTWYEYKRVFLGWRRHRWEFAGKLCALVANGLLPRKDRRTWRMSDFTTLIKPPPKWKAKMKSAAGLLKSLFCRKPVRPGQGTSAPAPGETRPDSP